ncbi:ABC transporter permease [Acinetobacter seifertii]|jgi:D-methionine transport system permease protein|uniref:ABC transporter permease n=4 Tax=Acinetobacter TaxID=469 RepID=A0A1Y3F9B2_9GAMM|nr:MULTISPECIES: methionine ABC transporter permease [Acinetobacter]KCX95102.1 binding--dependent transport system inner membrane component family protein [Acinetobacter baumannii 6112]KHO16187.1 methionine ABC transporter permease [Acinetobacter baumannii]MDQ9824208.1 methionine ABC transporter permease [Acinetobacter sp. 163]AZC02261.1 ABC transporter permease [Acinetobacter nosocomialis]AZC05935.1 ABC transporter permease [Acinetobacter nosocomialis]
MRDLIVQWLTELTQPFWQSSLSMDQFVTALQETFNMVFFALIFGGIWGFIQGIILLVTRPEGILPNKFIYHLLNPIVNALRSLPFIILLIAVIPLTKFLVGTSIGTWAAIVPLTIYVGPYMGRLIETSLLEVNEGIIESAQAMGATPWQIISRFILPEARSSLILNLTTATISLIGATAMAGAVGAGGIGDLAISYGYQRFDTSVVILTVIILLLLVQIVQTLGNWLSKIR